jgi:DNA-binding protein HU-beta
MTRSQMIETVARKTGFTEAQVETTMDAMFDQIADCLRADEKVTIAGFGRFEMRPRKPKAYTNPKTKVSSRLESTSIPGFKASGRFKQKLEAGKAKAAEENAPGDEQAMIEQIAAIYRRIEALPEQGRRIFKMICIEHKSYVETARLLSLSLHTVKTHMSRSFKALRKMSMFFLTLF